jgi:hypothetical protein
MDRSDLYIIYIAYLCNVPRPCLWVATKVEMRPAGRAALSSTRRSVSGAARVLAFAFFFVGVQQTSEAGDETVCPSPQFREFR